MTQVLHIAVCMKPVEGGFSENALKYGVAGLNIDGGRVKMADKADAEKHRYNCEGGYKRQKNWHLNDMSKGTLAGGWKKPEGEPPVVTGRWPANVIHDGSDGVVGEFPVTKAGVDVRRNLDGRTYNAHQEWVMKARPGEDAGYGDSGSGSASRFFKSLGKAK